MPLALEYPVSATLSLEDAASCDWDLAVVGAGPAGSMAARQAARLGASVVLIDKARFPRGKVCGCCLNTAALGILDAVGLGGLPRRQGAVPLERIRLAAGGDFADCALPGGVSLSREAFDAALVAEAVAAGASFLSETQASLATPGQAGPGDHCQSNFRLLKLHRQSHSAMIQARVVVAADGLAGRLLDDEAEIGTRVVEGSRLGAGTVLERAPAEFERGVIYMASGRGGYVGLVRLEDNRLDIAAALDRAEVRRHGSPGVVASAILCETGLAAPDGLTEAPWRGTPPLTRRTLRLGARRLFRVGDAAGYIEPFTGEGIAWALAGGAAVAPLALETAASWSDAVVQAWESRHRCLIASRQRTCRWVSRLLRRPRLCGAAVRLLRRAPGLAAPLVKSINRPFDLEPYLTSAGVEKA